MPLLQTPSPVAPEHPLRMSARGWALALGVVIGLIVLGLTVSGRLSPEPASAAILSLAAVGAVVWLARAPRIKQEAALAEQQAAKAGPATLAVEALAEVAEGLPDPVLVISGYDESDFAGRRVLFANLAARELFRASSETMLVTSVRNPEVLELVDRALFAGEEGQTAFEGGGVQERYWNVLVKPLARGPDGHRRALMVMRDQTDARRNERMRADFLANASHELRTPLASLAGFIDTLRGHAKDDEAARERFLAIMAAQAWRMARLIEDLMSLSRIELNEHIRPIDPVDLSMAISDVVDALGPQAQEAGVAFEVSGESRGGAVVTGDRDQIVQVIQNLVDNAIKYAGRGGRVSIELDSRLTAEGAIALRKPHAQRLSLLTPDHAEETYAAIRVGDSGPGLKREHLPRLTERFYRVEGQKSGERLGTGLGLAIVKHIMNRHHGGLAVESAEGEGAVFVVYFPLTRGDGGDLATGASSS